MREEKIVCAVSNDHPYRVKKVIRMEELQNEQLIVYPEICDVRKMIMNVFQCMGAKPIIAMVGAGLGITLLPETALQ
ncbi:LysR family transcriptional regulator [Bacillus mycoides]|nr:LysR family transcriptional regulator [Bacillus mycoides FSL H7-687]KZE04275.1 transcriptional regulator LysR family [Bacillus mycoides]OTY17925.1 LysR family transcriptional regulator [Bacillus mycoides]